MGFSYLRRRWVWWVLFQFGGCFSSCCPIVRRLMMNWKWKFYTNRGSAWKSHRPTICWKFNTKCFLKTGLYFTQGTIWNWNIWERDEERERDEQFNQCAPLNFFLAMIRTRWCMSLWDLNTRQVMWRLASGRCALGKKDSWRSHTTARGTGIYRYKMVIISTSTYIYNRYHLSY